MARAETTIKMSPEGHQALVAVLRHLAGKVDEETLVAVLRSQGRPVNVADRMVAYVAESVLLEVS